MSVARNILFLFLILSSWEAYSQFLQKNIYINYKSTRFYNADDIPTYTSSQSYSTRQTYVTKGNDLLYINSFAKQAAFRYSATEEDIVTIGYVKADTVRKGIVLAKWNEDFSSRFYGLITSSLEVNITEMTILEEDSTLLLTVYHTGDTLYYNPHNPNDYLFTPWNTNTKQRNYTGIFLDLDFNVTNVIPFTKELNTVDQLEICEAQDGFILKGTSFSVDTTKVYLNDTALAIASGSTLLAKFSSTGNYLWHYHITSGPEVNVLGIKQPLESPILLDIVVNSSIDTPIILNKNEIVVFKPKSLQNISINRAKHYFFKIESDGSFIELDTLSAFRKFQKGPYFAFDDPRHIDPRNIQVIDGGYDSIAIYKGVRYKNSDNTNLFVRTADQSIVDNRPLLNKSGSEYFSISRLTLTENDTKNYAYQADSSLGAIFKPTEQGYQTTVLARYDSGYDILWARAFHYTNAFVSFNKYKTVISGRSYGQSQDLHPDITGNSLDETREAGITVYDCVPIAYFRASENKEYSVQFENLSHMKVNYYWDFGDGNSSTEINPLHKFPRVSNVWYVVRLITENQCGKDTIEIPVYMDPNNVDVPKLSFNAYLNVYPNPVFSESQLTLLVAHFSEACSTKLSSMKGVTVWEQQSISTSSGQVTFDVPHLSPGAYIMHTTIGTEIYSKKIVVK